MRLGLLLLVLAAGCQAPLNFEKTVQLGAGDVQAFPVDAPRREQKVSVAVTSSNSPLDVYIVLEKDQEATKQALLAYRKPASVLAGMEKTQEARLEATIPARNAFVVMLGGATKDTSVKLKLTGR